MGCMTRTGRRNPGLKPAGAFSDAHQVSPRRITTLPHQAIEIAWLQGLVSGSMPPGQL